MFTHPKKVVMTLTTIRIHVYFIVVNGFLYILIKYC